MSTDGVDSSGSSGGSGGTHSYGGAHQSGGVKHNALHHNSGGNDNRGVAGHSSSNGRLGFDSLGSRDTNASDTGTSSGRGAQALSGLSGNAGVAHGGYGTRSSGMFDRNAMGGLSGQGYGAQGGYGRQGGAQSGLGEQGGEGAAGAQGGAGAQGAMGGRPLTQLPQESGRLSGRPQTYQTHASSGKQQINAALDRAGATPQEKALITAMGAQETNDFQASERDKKKDGKASANYSAFNLNAYELRKFGYRGNLNALNNQQNIGTAATTLLHGIRQYGANNVMNLTREGQSGEHSGNSADARSWRAGQVASAEEYLRRGPRSLVDNTRISAPAHYQ